MTTLLSNVRLKRCYLSSIKALNNIIEREYFKPQQNCAAHFLDIQNIADMFNSTINRVFGIPEHGKGWTTLVLQN